MAMTAGECNACGTGVRRRYDGQIRYGQIRPQDGGPTAVLHNRREQV